ncbi:MAG TPA: histidine phosphatase family protein [Alphaproteobacteria bacterium]|nr:histidine phosphatase family protein [Alphaproteobacteria bacterium]
MAPDDARVTRWWWIRHAPVTSDGGRVYGQSDVPCDCSDRAAFATLARRLPERAVWVTSQLKRTRMTAAAIRDAGLDLPEPIVEPAFAEQNFGVLQGRVRQEVFKDNPDWRGFWLAPARTAPTGGESFVDVIARVRPAIARLNEAHGGRDIVAVAHGGTIRAALALALALEPETALAFVADNLSLTRLDHIVQGGNEAWRVEAVNERSR